MRDVFGQLSRNHPDAGRVDRKRAQFCGEVIGKAAVPVEMFGIERRERVHRCGGWNVVQLVGGCL